MSQAWDTQSMLQTSSLPSWSSQTSKEMQTNKMEKIYSEVLGSQLWKHLRGLELKGGVFKLAASSETNSLLPLRQMSFLPSDSNPYVCPPELSLSADVHGCCQ